MKEFTSGADRIRTMNDAELAESYVKFATELIDAVLEGTDIHINHRMELYKDIMTKQLQMPTLYEPKRYTLEEMMVMEEGTKVYVHYIGPCHGFYPDVTAPWYASEECIITVINERISKLHMPMNLYDKSWCAYAYKPNDLEINPPEKELVQDIGGM
ncbi:MAG: hypothetical protein IJZ68_06185 [Bacteroidaceae bacterium]|nr:hypothetical protein [Bacteroidaceae bacterium]